MAYYTTWSRSLTGWGPVATGYSWTRLIHNTWLTEWHDPASTGSMTYLGQVSRAYYMTYYGTYCTTYESPKWRFVGPYRVGFQPPGLWDGWLKAPYSVYGSFVSALWSKLRIQNMDGSKWAEIYINTSSEQAIITSSNGSISLNWYDTALDDTNCFIEVDIASAGTFTARFYSSILYVNDCYADEVLEYTYTSPVPLFDVDEPIKSFYIIDVPSGTADVSPTYYRVNATFINPASAPSLDIVEATLPFPTLVETGAQDNEVPTGVLPFWTDIYHIFTTTAEIQSRLEAFFTIINDCYWQYGNTYTTLRNPSYLPISAILNIPLEKVSYIFNTIYAVNNSLIITNSDGSKWFRVYNNISNYLCIDDSVNGELYLSTEIFGNASTLKQSLTYDGAVGELTVNFINAAIEIEYLNIFDLYSVFDRDEELYFGVGTIPGRNYCYFYEYIFLISESIPHSVELGQSENTKFHSSAKALELTSQEYYTEQFCFFKQKIRNSQDYSDLNSLYGIDPGYPSDSQVPLKAKDACIVHDDYNRFYFYTVKEGPAQDSLPDIIRATPNLHWKLQDVVGVGSMLVEQYDVVGLVSGNDVIITHTEHNRIDNGFAPSVQIIHNNIILTSKIITSVVSTTQIRLSTSETEVFTNLKINIFITPVN